MHVEVTKMGEGRQSNPSPVISNRPVAPLFDDLGRQIIRHSIRDLVYTASASLTTGTATTLRAGVTSAYLDLVQVTAANNSTAAAQITISDESTVVRTIQVPAASTLHIVFDPPLKQSATGVNWNADMEDITGTTVSLSAEFVEEI